METYGQDFGKLTRALCSRGLEVVAVEPDPQMRSLLAAGLADVDVREGTAEALPLGDAEVDAVLFATAWHWVDPVRSAAEAARVLSGSGHLGMMWNFYDDRVAWGKMIEHLKRACRETGKDCRLLMDLAGPKLRTGAMEPGPRVVCWEPKRDVFGKAVAPASIWLTPLDSFEQPPLEAEAVLPLDGQWLARLRTGDRIRFRDLRGKTRVLGVKQADGATRPLAKCWESPSLGQKMRAASAIVVTSRSRVCGKLAESASTSSPAEMSWAL
jgi:SAM-dependent methyltransferase